MPKPTSALEAIVGEHTRKIDGLEDTMKEMLEAINGLRSDMAERGQQMIGMLNTQNTMLIKNQTDHEAMDITRFADIKNKMALYVGMGMGGCSVISLAIAGLGLWLKH